MNCTIIYTDAEGNPSLLHPELEAEYGEQAALGLFRQVRDAVDAGRFLSRKLRSNGEPTLEQVKELLIKGKLEPPTAAMVSADKLDAIKEQLLKALPRLEARLKKYRESKSGSGLAVKDKAVKELAEVVEAIRTQDMLTAYVDLVQYADKQLRTYKDFLKEKFDATAAVQSRGENMHPAALEEIAIQLKTFEGVFSPELARDNTTLKNILTGTDSTVGLNALRSEVAELVTEKTRDYLTQVVVQLANREGLSQEQIADHIKGGKDVLAFTKALGGASDSSLKLISAAFTARAEAALTATQQSNAFDEHVIELTAALRRLGVKDFAFMTELDAAGKTTSRYVQEVGRSYYELRRKLQVAKSEAGDYIPGVGLSKEEKQHNIKAWHARQALRLFRQAEDIDEDGNTSDGEHHQYTAAFKAVRDQYQELRQDGKFWYWGRKQGNLGFATMEEAEENYQRFLRKYYSEETIVQSMLRDNGQPTGELTTRLMRFTNPDTTTEVRLDKHEDTRHAALRRDTSEAGKAKFAYYQFFTQQLASFVNDIGKAKAGHILQGNLPAVQAAVTSEYNSKEPGYLDWAGRLVANPLETLKGLSPAVVAGQKGVATGEDGMVEQDVPLYFTGQFKNLEKIEKLQAEYDSLDKQSAEYGSKEAKLKTALTIERNRIERSQGETDLSRLLMAFGRMSTMYKGLKQQEGTLKLIKHAIANREYYLEKDGDYLLDKEGNPIVKEGYQSQASKQYSDWLDQNFYADLGLEKSEAAQWAKTFQRYTSLTFQGLNFSAALRNFTVGNLNNRVVAAGKQFGWDKKVANAALAFVTKDIANVIADRFADHLDRKSYMLRPRKSIVDALMHHYDFLQHNTPFDEVRTNSPADALYWGSTGGEYHIQSQTAVAKMMSTELVGKNGETSTFLAAHSLVNGKLQVDPNYAEAAKEVQNRLVLDVRNINKRIHGNYSQDDKVSLQKDWLGSMALQFHKWLFAGVKARWGRQQFDEGTSIDQKGYYRSLKTIWDAIRRTGLRMESYDSLPELEKANLRMVAQEVKYVVGVMALALIASALKPEPDDKDNKVLYMATNLFQRTMEGTRGELMGYSNPIDVYGNLKNPIAGLGSVKDMGVFLKNAVDVPIYGLTGQADKLDYQTGSLKGSSKLWKSTKDLIPVLRMDRTLEQLKTTGSVWIK